jgi:hypothetical protein
MWREFPDNFREYYRMNILNFNYIFDSMKDDLQSYSNFRKCIEAEDKHTVALQGHSPAFSHTFLSKKLRDNESCRYADFTGE